jgi:hypothetical protein
MVHKIDVSSQRDGFKINTAFIQLRKMPLKIIIQEILCNTFDYTATQIYESTLGSNKTGVWTVPHKNVEKKCRKA